LAKGENLVRGKDARVWKGAKFYLQSTHLVARMRYIWENKARPFPDERKRRDNKFYTLAAIQREPCSERRGEGGGGGGP